jgi:hypothetical protein
VGALALIAAFLGYLQHRRGLTVAMFVVLAIAVLGAVAFSIYFVPKIDALRLAGQSESLEFKSLHKQSEHLMSGVMAVLFVAALLLPAFCRAMLVSAKARSESLPA